MPDTFKASRKNHTERKKHHLNENVSFLGKTGDRPPQTNTFLRECGKGVNEIGHSLNASSQQGDQTLRIAYGAHPFAPEQTNLVNAMGGVHNLPLQRVGGLMKRQRML